MIPLEIPFDSIELGERGRSRYDGIEFLAESIVDNGLIQPLILVPLDNGNYGLDAGGRRYHALKLLKTKTLFHATTSDPERPGFVLKGEAFSTPLQRIMTEIAENLNRENMPWQDECGLIVKAYRMTQKDAHARGEEIIMASFGKMLGVSFSKLQAAVAIYDDLVLNPARYKDVTSIRGAYAKIFKANEAALTKILAAKRMSSPSLGAPSSVPIQPESKPGEESPIHVPLTNAFNNVNSLEYMLSLKGPVFDHIVTDPDYAISVDRLNANMVNAGAGVHQDSVESSILHLYTFITLAFKCLKDQGFLVFFYDLDHHEKLQRHAESVGFRVQRWPLIWHKTDYFSNADPGHNFCKNMEYAMVCRKPNGVLSQAQKSSIFQCSSGIITKEFQHPFAKPLDLWRWIYGAIAIKGQLVYDPFLGSGSAAAAAVLWGLQSVGSEISADHYASALVNLQNVFKKMMHGKKVTFS